MTVNLRTAGSARSQKKIIPPPIARSEGWPWQEAVGVQSGKLSFPAPPKRLPKISIITPCFNSAAYLERTIRSILLQGYENLEYMVIDGGSTDGTLELLQYYSDGIDWWVSKPDRGQSDALNRGLDLATGDILGWLNGDDLYLPGALQAIAESYWEDPSRNVFLALGTIVDQQLKFIHRQSYARIGPEAFLDWRKNYIIQPGCFFSKKAWKTCRPIREDLQYCMDFDLFVRMSRQFEFHKIDREIAYSVFHSDCKTVRDRAASIMETAMVQVQFGGWEIAKRELDQVAWEHKYLEGMVGKQRGSGTGGKPNVLFAITHLEIGGAQTFLVRLICSLADRVNPFLLLFWPEKADGGLLAHLPESCTNITGYELTDPENFRSKVMELGIDAVNCHLFHADRFVTAALKDADVPILLSEHGDYKYVEDIGLTDAEEVRQILRRADTIAVICDCNGRSLRERYGPELSCRKINLGVEPWVPTGNRSLLRRALGIPEQEMVFICVARGNEDKGWADLLNCFWRLRARTERNPHLVLLGDGDYLQQLHSCAGGSAVENVHFLGFQVNPRAWMEMADVSVLLSYFPGESSPCSLIESLSVGLPVIATDVGGIGEIVGTDGERGRLIPLDERRQADIDSAVAAMLFYLEDGEAYRQAAARAKKAFDEQFSMERVSGAYWAEIKILSQSKNCPSTRSFKNSKIW